jgi:hypothetical protein
MLHAHALLRHLDLFEQIGAGWRMGRKVWEKGGRKVRKVSGKEKGVRYLIFWGSG